MAVLNLLTFITGLFSDMISFPTPEKSAEESPKLSMLFARPFLTIFAELTLLTPPTDSLRVLYNLLLLTGATDERREKTDFDSSIVSKSTS